MFINTGSLFTYRLRIRENCSKSMEERCCQDLFKDFLRWVVCYCTWVCTHTHTHTQIHEQKQQLLTRIFHLFRTPNKKNIESMLLHKVLESQNQRVGKLPGMSSKAYHDSNPCSKTCQLLELLTVNILSLYDLLQLLIIQLILLPLPHSLSLCQLQLSQHQPQLF